MKPKSKFLPEGRKFMSNLYFCYDTEDGFQTFTSKEECEKYANKCIQDYLSVDGWSEDVIYVSTGIVTHEATQADLVERPETVDEDGCDESGEYWGDFESKKCSYTLKPISSVGE